MARKKRTRKSIAKALKSALLADRPMARALFENELEECIEGLVKRKRGDGGDYLFAVTENGRDVAMLLIDKGDAVRVNEEARMRLQELWSLAYRTNMNRFIPHMVEGRKAGHIFVLGFKAVDDPRMQSSAR
jgi:hypothetical protein